MRFRSWLQLRESGQTIIKGRPVSITVLLHGKPTTFRGVTMFDPRFELQNLPVPADDPARSPRFLGSTDFSLPLVGQNGNVSLWLVSRRDNELYGTGFLSAEPRGYAIQNTGWADRAIIVGQNGRDMVTSADDDMLKAFGDFSDVG